MAQDFPTTQWTLLHSMRDGDKDVVRLAMSRLYDIYWPPLYAYLRHRGHPQDAAGDILQGFFVHLLVSGGLKTGSAERGRFRSFLLTSLKNFMVNERVYANAIRRAPSEQLLSLNVSAEEHSVRARDDRSLNPEEIYEQRWALLVAERAFRRLEKLERQNGRGDQLELLRGHLLDGGEQPTLNEIADQLGVSEATLRVRIHRLRQRFGSALRSEVEQTLTDASEVDTEIKLLLTQLNEAGGFG